MRYAIYFTPPAQHPLTRAAARWIGRDAFTGEPLLPPPLEGIDAAEHAAITAAPRRYGFHATLKAPFRLAEGETEAGLAAALDEFASRGTAERGPVLGIGQLDGFFALLPNGPSEALRRLADEVVTVFDRFRAPLTDADIARRNPAGLAPGEQRNLARWGYPYVFDAFRFHMTLTGRIEEARAQAVMRALARNFGPLLDEPVELSGVALFVEPRPGEPFVVRSMHPFRHHSSRRYG